jgi:geranylgeranyl diphosphate synthase, type II
MDAMALIERSLAEALSLAQGPNAPPKLTAAMRHAVFPGGARIRPRLCLAVARACGNDRPAIATAMAASIELMHCASLVHDDLPCFDDAATRRGRPSVHKAHGEQIAVLAGDALIVLAFQSLACAAGSNPGRLASLVQVLARASGAPHGITAGQAWESEPAIALAAYQRAKTGALFAAATSGGAGAAGAREHAWHELGERIGEAYQIADDVRDVVSSESELGKPVGQDEALHRPNAVAALGLRGAIGRLESLVAAAIEAIPPCPGARQLRAHILSEAGRLLPAKLARPAA